MSRPLAHTAARAPAGLLSLALALTLVGCRPTPDPSPTPAPLPPPEERLDFHWHEDLDVPTEAREAVDMLHHWIHAYNLWATEPSIIPDYIYHHSDPSVFERIESASGAPQPMAGTVHAYLVEIEFADGDPPTVEVGICESGPTFHMIDETGEPINNEGFLSSRRAVLTRAADGRWIVAERTSFGVQDLRAVCERRAALLAGTSPSTTAPGG
ncbi:hypothetical protein JQS43_04365 [Natronosporangium hydrolyticum]|uniref:Nuclear transport factor 2 family protein n=1 Tax=Natronosporangium hydrolyticum TaxID=2811111 RepID=A0A895YDG7_9ACTN|nr:hypothetical protein [Natronosporangium hydrolyticum]QSB15591.1 hypothetical protein JQS43_04365 [Natronosporangium hydrolyticum]